MNAAILSPELRAAAPGLAQALRRIFTGLAALIAHAFLKDPLHVALIVPLWTRLNRAARRADRLPALLAIGQAPRPASRPAARAPKARAARAPQAKAGLRPSFPSRKGWVVAAIGYRAAAFTCHLEHLLEQPDIAALVAHSPQAARLLRPICHMLGVTHAALRRPARPRRAVPEMPVPAPPPLSHSAPCPHVFWPWFPRAPAPAARGGLLRLNHGYVPNSSA